MHTRKRWPRGTWMRLQSPDTLKALMKQKHIGLDRLSRSVGCSRGFISHLTSGRRSSCKPLTAERIAEALDVPLNILFDVRESTTSTTDDKHKVSAA
jgi:transcriptional regulator with XRE-family HTH domain